MIRASLLVLFVVGGVLALATLPARDAAASLAMLDVGQGDSLLVDAGVPLMIDTGNPGAGVLSQAGKLGVRPAALLLTHLHDDHAGDAAAIIRTGLAAVFWNGRTDGVSYARIAEEAARSDVPLVALTPGDRLRAGEAIMTVLGPSPGYRTSNDLNDGSLVLRADLPGFSAILTGDATSEAEVSLPPGLLDADVLKLGHHGSKGSSGEAFIDAVTPEIALVSSGAGNRYGHPAPETLARLAARAIRVRDTQEEGTVIITAEDVSGHVE